MIYRLLALNIDGTLLQSNGKLQKSTKEAVDYVKNKGIYVTLVTSRSFPSAKRVAKALKLDTFIVTHRGAYIANSYDKTILVRRIPEDITFEVVRFLEGLPCQMRVVHEKYSIANKLKFRNNLMARMNVNMNDPIFYSQQFVEYISDELMNDPCAALNIEVYFEESGELDDVTEALRNTYSEIDLIKLENNRIDIVPKGVSKLNGLLFLGEQLGIKRNEMVAIGDSLDDLEMIEEVGLGVAMGNSPHELKRSADWVTRTNNQHGVGYMVKEHFRKQQPIDFLRKMNIIK